MRADLLVTTSVGRADALTERARTLADELQAALVPRRRDGFPEVFARHPEARRLLVVQTERLLLVSSEGWEFFFHPNLAFLRLGNILRGGRDLLLEAADLGPGDSVLDGTLGFAAEAILCAHAVGESGEVHGVEAVPELGVVVRDGLARRVTAHRELNAAMRRVRVVHLGSHLEYLRACPDRRYDVVCFDPFFEAAVDAQETLANLRAFGEHTPLQPAAIDEARRVARRRVLVKTARWSSLLDDLGIAERVDSRSGKVAYGVLRVG